ncbi:response regulator [Leptospira sp. 85282-16]|uniref:Response regulator n=2 Tax=Leptospira TaxID=171 RepID=A0ABY2LND2_9LEPT|nr:response regulator [Leptospira montravelensis]MCT8334129.1 response regulator [Leptospira sp. 85282-16]TGK81235.1 response regulator [Leptospira montravelensis]TGL00689.1 response regulator [Leptospira montravelensis]
MAIENDPNSSQDLENIFLGLRQRVVITKFSQTVQEYVKSSNPDIILMGLSFKDKKELEFVLELRRDVITHNIPILAMIPKEDSNFIANHKALGFTDYMVKPLIKQPLLDRIHSHIEEYKFSESSKTRDNMSFVVVDRGHGRVLFQCRANLKRYVFPEFKKIFTPNFLKSIQAERICFDVRVVPELGKEEVEVFERVMKLFLNHEKVVFIAGRHMGAFIEHAADDEKMLVFMAPNEFDEYVKMEDQKKEEIRKKEKKEKFIKETGKEPAQSPTLLSQVKIEIPTDPQDEAENQNLSTEITDNPPNSDTTDSSPQT